MPDTPDLISSLIDRLPPLSAGEQLPLCGVPFGMSAAILTALYKRYGSPTSPLLFVAADERALNETAEALSFFAPQYEHLCYPPWDCQPYDRVSPSREHVATRLACLDRLSQLDASDAPPSASSAPAFVLTTLAAVLQRVVPKEFIVANPSLVVRARQPFDRNTFIATAIRNGYSREEVVHRAGDFALRGSLVDVFPPDEAQPLRIDLDGDKVVSVKRFDAITQRSNEAVGQVRLLQACEAPLSSEDWRMFCARYRQRFGVEFATRDPLFASAEAEQPTSGFEHLLPLFFDRMHTLKDHLPKDTLLVLGQETREASKLRLETIADHAQARLTLRDEAEKARKKGAERFETEEGGNFRAVLPPDTLYLTEQEWQQFANTTFRATVRLHRAPALAPTSASAATLKGLLPSLDCGGRPCPDFALALSQERLYEDLRTRVLRKRHVFAAHPESALVRLATRLRENAVPLEPVRDYAELTRAREGVPGGVALSLRQGFDSPSFCFVSESELFGERYGAHVRRRTRPLEVLLAEARTLAAGDLVVHDEHGIGKFEGLLCIEIDGAPHDCVTIAYAGDERLYLPVEGLESLSRFGDEGEGSPKLDRLGGTLFAVRKARAKRRIKDLAEKLIATMAERQLKRAPVFQPRDGLWQDFQMGFPYMETEDQQSAIRDVIEDLASGRVMDRMVCGDAGFGKTEVALRAAFVVAAEGAQVLMLAPTTLLAEQHARLFQQRFARLPASANISIGILSRLRSAKERVETKKKAERGELGVLIGTHAALAKGIALPKLGLLVIDEEQSFGVEQKERWKESCAHILSLSATPIPRSLNMALSGLRDLSPLLSAPYDRLNVRSFVLDFDAVSLSEALRRERLREGQAFCVVPRIADLKRTEALLRRLAPEARLVVAHGRLPPSELEQRMRAFLGGECDLLLATNIVEAGLDIPRANTMIILDAHRFGLAQLYQLRGRVGRAKLRGYCYFCIPEYARKQKSAMQRLNLMETLDSAGAGLRVSMQDLDMRGAGNLLGEEQSGKIREVGVELYRKLLSQAIRERKSGIATEDQQEDIPTNTRIALGIPVLIPASYVVEEGLRMALYRRLALLEDEAARRDFREELQDRFGEVPEEVDNLLALFRIKEQAARANIESLEAGEAGITVRFRDNVFAKPQKLLALIERQQKKLTLGKDQSLSWRVRLGGSAALRTKAAETFARTLAGIALAGIANEGG